MYVIFIALLYYVVFELFLYVFMLRMAGPFDVFKFVNDCRENTRK